MAEPVDEPEVEAEQAFDRANPEAVTIALGRTSRGGGRTPVDARAEAFLDEQTELIRLQKEHLHEQRGLQLQHLKVRRWKDRMSLAVQGVGVLVGIAVVAGLGAAAWQAQQDRSLVIEAFSTPPAYAQQGLSGEVLAGELMDRLSSINRVVAENSITTSNGVKADRRDDIKVEIPETGVSIGEIGRLLREWLGRQTRIDGELRQTADGKLLLTARMDGQAFSVSGAPADLDKLEQQIAEQVFAASDPSNFVIYLDAVGRPLEALAGAERLARSDPRGVSLWATEEHELDPVRNLALARTAARVDPGSPYSHFEQARAEFLFGHDEAALGAARRLSASLAGELPEGLKGAGGDFLKSYAEITIATSLGDYARAAQVSGRIKGGSGSAEAIAADDAWGHDLGRASDLLDLTRASGDPETAGQAGARAAIAAEAGDWAGAAAAAANATELDRAAHAKDPVPEGVAGFAQVEAARDGPLLAEARARLGDFTGAEAALAGAPPDCNACLRARGRIAALRGDYAGAERWFAEAVRQAPSIPFAYTDWGRMLLAKGDVARAIEKLKLAHEKGPRFADPLELWGEALMAKGDYKGAAAKFEEAARYAPAWDENRRLWRAAQAKATGHG